MIYKFGATEEKNNMSDFFEALSRCVLFYDRRTNRFYEIKRVVLTHPSSQENVYARISKMHNVVCDESYPIKVGNEYVVTYMKLIYCSFIPARNFYL